MAVLVRDLCQISFRRIDIVDLAAGVVLYTGKKFLVIGITERTPQGIPDRGDLVGIVGERKGLPGWELHLSQGVSDIAQPNAVAVEISDGDKPSLYIIAVDFFLLDCSQTVSIPKERDRSAPDRKSTRLNSSHVSISYAVFCLKKKTTTNSQRAH